MGGLRLLPALAVLLLAAGCGGEDDAAVPERPQPHPPVSSPAPPSVDDVEEARGGPVQLRLVAAYDVTDPECAADPVPARPAPEGRQVTLCDRRGLAHRLEPAGFHGPVADARAVRTEDSSAWVVAIELDGRGTAALERLSGEAAGSGRQLAIVHGGRVLSAPTVSEPIDGGSLTIAASFSAGEAEALAVAISGR